MKNGMKYRVSDETWNASDVNELVRALEELALLANYDGLPSTAHLINVAVESIRCGTGHEALAPVSN